MNQDQLKQVMAQAVIDHILPHLDNKNIVGVGTGFTANFFVNALVRHKAEFDDAVVSSEAITKHLEEYGILVYELNMISELEFYVDSADEGNECLELIRGSGATLTCEKIVAAVVKTFIYIADASKLVPILDQFPLLVEAIPMVRSHVARQLMKLGGDPVYHEGMLTDNGNIILDAHDLRIDSPVELEEKINAIVGMVVNGLFAARPADLLLPDIADGVKTPKA